MLYGADRVCALLHRGSVVHCSQHEPVWEYQHIAVAHSDVTQPRRGAEADTRRVGKWQLEGRGDVCHSVLQFVWWWLTGRPL